MKPIKNPRTGPAHSTMIDGTLTHYEGLTLLDYFAGQSLAGINANTQYMTAKQTAEACYKDALAMLKHREEILNNHNFTE